jgi:protein-tyrosine phosphatase
VAQDLEDFDHIFTIDEHNYRNVLTLTSNPQLQQKVQTFVRLLTQPLDRIPDPYYGDLQDFDHVLDLLEDGCPNFLKDLRNRQGG